MYLSSVSLEQQLPSYIVKAFTQVLGNSKSDQHHKIENEYSLSHIFRGTSTRKVFPNGRESEGSDSKSKIII